MVSLSPRYIPLVERHDCCAVTCLQMLLYRNGFGLFDQEQLAKFFDVRVNKEHQDAFNVRLKSFSRYNYDEGISTLDSAGKVNDFFHKNRINLVARAKRLSEIEDLGKFIESNIISGNDLWVEYKAHEIHSHDRLGGKYLHDGLIESIDTKKNEVVIIDPFNDHKPRIKVKLKTLYDSLSTKFGKETGFLIISKKTKSRRNLSMR